MFEFLERLRQKPEPQKKLIAFSTALAFSGVILLLWLLVWYPNFKEGETKKINMDSTGPSPWSTFTSALQSGFGEISNQAHNIKELTERISSSSPQKEDEKIMTKPKKEVEVPNPVDKPVDKPADTPADNPPAKSNPFTTIDDSFFNR